MAGILEGIRIVDLTRYIAGPYCGALLADMGAEVIKVEKPGAGEATRTVGPWKDGVSLFFPAYNRNKKSVTADLRTPQGIEVAKKLIEKSDVIIENFRVGVMDKMGLGYEEIKKINPRMIMVSVTGFGQSGPMSRRTAFDGIISSVSGVTRMEKGRVERSKGPIHDYMAAMYAAFGTVLALYERDRTGEGQYLDVSMVAGSSMIRTTAIADASVNGDEVAISGDDSSPYGYLKAEDGWINFHAGTDPLFRRLLKLIPDNSILGDPKYLDNIELRVTDMDLLMEEIQMWANGKTCGELEKEFISADIPCGICATPGRLLRDPHLNENGYIIRQDVHGVGEVAYMGFPFKMSAHPELEYRPAPKVGEHTEEIYRNVLQMTEGELEQLKMEGII